MKNAPGGLILGAVVALLVTALTSPVGGQTAARAKAASTPPRYDLAKEVALEGTIDQIVTNPSPGMLAGAHIMIATGSGTVDAHLGLYAMRGTNALKLVPGEQARVTGVLVNVAGRTVMLVRTVQTTRGIRAIRNANGFLLQPASSTATRPEGVSK